MASFNHRSQLLRTSDGFAHASRLLGSLPLYEFALFLVTNALYSAFESHVCDSCISFVNAIFLYTAPAFAMAAISLGAYAIYRTTSNDTDKATIIEHRSRTRASASQGIGYGLVVVSAWLSGIGLFWIPAILWLVALAAILRAR